MPTVIDPTQFGLVGDGQADDGPALRALLVTVQALGGGSVTIPPGDYLIDSPAGEWPAPALLVPADTHVIAHGARFIRGLSLKARMVQNFDGVESNPGYSGHSNIVIEGGTWDGNAPEKVGGGNMMAFTHATNIEIRGARFLDQPSNHAIEFNAVDDGRVINCRFEGSVPKDGSPQTTEAIQIDGSWGAAGLEGGFPYDNTPSKNILVDGCTFTSSSKNGPWGLAVGSHAGHSDCHYEGIRVVNNRMVDNLCYAVRTWDWKDSVISNNVITSSEGPDYKAAICVASGTTRSDGVMVTGNVVRYASGPGYGSIDLRTYAGSEGPVYGAVVSSNLVQGFKDVGIKSAGDAAQINNNSLRAARSTAVRGIEVVSAGGSWANVNDNRITGGLGISYPAGQAWVDNNDVNGKAPTNVVPR